MVFTHQNPSCTNPQLSHLIQLQGSLLLPPRPAGSFLLPSRAGTAQPCQGQPGPPGSLPCVPQCPQLWGCCSPALKHRSDGPEGLLAGTSLPAQEQRGQGGTKPHGHRVASSQGAHISSKPHFHQGLSPKNPGRPGLEDVQHTLALFHVCFSPAEHLQ